MTDLRQISRKFLLEFIEIYRSFPCLWKIKSREYSDRIKKDKAYEQLLKKLKEVDVDATKEEVKKKIDSLRAGYRREVKKVTASKRSGAGGENVYIPSLWYFDELNFLGDQEIPRASVSNIEDDENLSMDNNSDRTQNSQEEVDEFYDVSILLIITILVY